MAEHPHGGRVKRAPPRHWCIDFETTNWDQALLAVAIRDDGAEMVWPIARGDPAADAAAFQAKEGGTWWAHAGGIFDHLLCFRHNLPRKVTLTGTTVLKAEGQKVKGRPPLVWRDTYPWWQSSLEKVGKLVGLPKLPDVDRSRCAEMAPAELLRYCRRDVEVLWRGIRAAWRFLDERGARRSYTSGGAAIALLETLDPDTWEGLAHAPVEPDVIAHELDERGHVVSPETPVTSGLIRGGRVETRVIGHVAGPVYAYDVHSSYPASYREGPLPVGCVRTTSTNVGADGWWDCCDWTAPPRDHVLTALELGDGGIGVGDCHGWLTSEMAHWLQSQGCVVTRRGIGFRGEYMLPRFAERFAAELFAAKESGEASAAFAKVWLNSLHGKLGEGLERFEYRLDDCDRYERRRVVARVQPYRQPLTGAFVLQRARLRLNRAVAALEADGWPVFYMDTDCVHTRCPPECFARILPLGPECGQWGLEFAASDAWYLAPKVYRLEAPGKAKTAAKGFARNGLSQDTFWRALRGEAPEIPRGGLRTWRAGVDSYRPDAALAAPRRHSFGERIGALGGGAWVPPTRALRPVHHGRERIPTAEGFDWLRYLPKT